MDYIHLVIYYHLVESHFADAMTKHGIWSSAFGSSQVEDAVETPTKRLGFFGLPYPSVLSALRRHDGPCPVFHYRDYLSVPSVRRITRKASDRD